MRKGLIILAAVAAAAALLLLLFALRGFRTGEAYSAVRAYRTAVYAEYDNFLDIDDPIVIDPAGPVDEDLRKEIQEAFTIINEERMKKGLPPLQWNQRLEECANIRAMELSRHFDGEHIRPNGKFWFMVDPMTVLGENIYRGHKAAGKALKSWMNNPPDGENFLCDYFTRVGISLYRSDRGEYLWAMMFGADTVKVTLVDRLQPGSVWILADTDSNRRTSVWGPAMMQPEETGAEYRAGIPRAEDGRYLFRMIDGDGMYYEADIPRLLNQWRLELSGAGDDAEIFLRIYDDQDSPVQECPVFCAAL